AYEIKYAQAYNEGDVFVRDRQTGQFLLEKDFIQGSGDGPATAPVGKAVPTARESEFHRFINGPARLTLPSDPKTRAMEVKSQPKLKAAIEGKEFVPVRAEEVGVEAVDDFTFRVTLRQSAPYFVGLMCHQFFRAVPRHVIEKYGDLAWTQPRHIVTS